MPVVFKDLFVSFAWPAHALPLVDRSNDHLDHLNDPQEEEEQYQIKSIALLQSNDRSDTKLLAPLAALLFTFGALLCICKSKIRMGSLSPLAIKCNC